MKDSFSQRLRTAWNTLWDRRQSRMIISGPLPLWMQNAFEEEAERVGVPVSEVIYDILFHTARHLIMENEECQEEAHELSER